MEVASLPSADRKIRIFLTLKREKARDYTEERKESAENRRELLKDGVRERKKEEATNSQIKDECTNVPKIFSAKPD